MSGKSEDIFSFSEGNTEKDDSLDLNSFSSIATDSARKKRARKKTGKQRVIKIILTLFLVGVITLSLVIGAFLLYAFTMVDGTMDVDLDNLALNFTTTIYTQNESGEWVEYQRLHGMYNRIWVAYDRKDALSGDESYEGIPENLVNAFVAIEDRRFREHDGVDWKRTAAAFLNLLKGSKSYGGSTITQQLVKNLTSDDSKEVSRKVREIMRSRYLEGHYAKDTIIECYLNTIALGHGVYGVEVAANYYFNKSVNDLTLAECATLAAITKSPSNYAPDKDPETTNSQNNKKRRITVLNEMLEQKYITDEQYEAAKAEEVKIVATKDAMNETEINNYYVDALIVQVTKDIAAKYGYDEKHAAEMFYKGGYKIYATVDPKIQSTVDEVFANSEKYGIKSADGSQLQGAITVMDYAGHVKGLSGGIGQKTVNLGISGFNRATDAVRQPGSTMKPISTYAPAIENGLINYSTVVYDNPDVYKVAGKNWTPKNYDGAYRGKTMVPKALEISLNTIPVQLVDKLTPQVCFDFLTQKLGITTLNEEDKNLAPLGMGGTNGGITTIESAAAYAAFGNGGKYYKPTLYYKVCDQHDNIVLNGEPKPSVAIGADTATVMNQLLQNVVYGDNGTGRIAAGYIPNMKIYAKTGTTNEVNDLWFVGGSPYYVASCWCGYDKMQRIGNSSIAKTMWGAVMSKVHTGLTPKEFPVSDYAVKRYYCTASGGLATEGCPAKAVGWYKKNNVPGVCREHTGAVLDSPDAEKKDTDEKQN